MAIAALILECAIVSVVTKESIAVLRYVKRTAIKGENAFNPTFASAIWVMPAIFVNRFSAMEATAAHLTESVILLRANVVVMKAGAVLIAVMSYARNVSMVLVIMVNANASLVGLAKAVMRKCVTLNASTAHVRMDSVSAIYPTRAWIVQILFRFLPRNHTALGIALLRMAVFVWIQVFVNVIQVALEWTAPRYYVGTSVSMVLVTRPMGNVFVIRLTTAMIALEFRVEIKSAHPMELASIMALAAAKRATLERSVNCFLARMIVTGMVCVKLLINANVVKVGRVLRALSPSVPAFLLAHRMEVA